MDKKKNDPADLLVIVQIILIIIFVFIFATQSLSLTDIYWIALAFTIILSIFFVYLALKTLSRPTNKTVQQSNESHSKPQDKSNANLHSPIENPKQDTESERMEKYRKFYDLPDDTPLYKMDRIYSPYPITVNTLEMAVAKYLARDGLFSPKCIFLDTYLKNKKGNTSQIDVIAVGKRGIFVFEVKDYSGWIFGNGNQTKWTQTLYRKKYHFYNPIKQNSGHIKALKSLLGDKPKYHSLIVFGDDAEIKDVSYIPKDTYVLLSYRIYEALIDICKQQECLTAQEVLEICRKIQSHRIMPNENLSEKHIEEIKEMTGENRLYS